MNGEVLVYLCTCTHTWQCVSTVGPQQADGAPVTMSSVSSFFSKCERIHCWIFNHQQNVKASLCFDRRECFWLLQYVWVAKEQPLIISPAQCGSGRAFIKGLLAVCKAFNVPNNHPHTRKLTTSAFLFYLFLLLLFNVNIERGNMPGYNIIPSTIQSIQVCFTSVEGKETEGWSGMAIVLTAKKPGPQQ